MPKFKYKKISEIIKENSDDKRLDVDRLRFESREQKIEYIRKLKREYKLKHERHIRLCRKDCVTFIEFVIKDDRPEHKGERIKLGDVHREIIHHFLSGDRRICIIPREHGKTTVLIGIILWLIGNDPNLRIKLVCNSDENAKKRLSEISQYINTDPDLKKVFPNLKPHPTASWTKFQATVARDNISREPTFEACPILGSSTGSRADILFVDDPVDFQNAILKPAMQTQIKIAFKSVWSNIVSDKGKILYIATLWTKDDLTHDLMRRKSYKTYKRAIGPNFEPVWPECWPISRLIAKKEEIGLIEFDRNFRHKVMSSENKTFDDAIIESLQDRKLAIVDVLEEWAKFGGLDLAISEKKDAAYTVLLTTAINAINNHRIVVEIQRGRLSSPNTAAMVYSQYQKWRHQHIGLEINNYQRSLKQWMDIGGYAGVPFWSYFTGNTETQTVDGGIHSMAAEMASGIWHLPFQDHKDSDVLECRCIYHKFLEELEDWPRGKTKDILMACWLCRETIRKFRGTQLIRVLDLQTETQQNGRRVERSANVSPEELDAIMDEEKIYSNSLSGIFNRL